MSERMRDFLDERDRADLWDSMLVTASMRETPEEVESWMLHCAEVWAHRQGTKIDRPQNRAVLDWVILEAFQRAPEEFRLGCRKACEAMRDKRGKPQERYRTTRAPGRHPVTVLARDVSTREAVAPLVDAIESLSALSPELLEVRPPK